MHARQTLTLAVAAMAFAALGYEVDLREPNDGTRVLAAKELRHHLELKAAEEPCRSFVFAKPDDAPAPEPFESRDRDEMPDIYAAIDRLGWSEIRYWQVYDRRLAAKK